MGNVTPYLKNALETAKQVKEVIEDLETPSPAHDIAAYMAMMLKVQSDINMSLAALTDMRLMDLKEEIEEAKNGSSDS